MIRTAVIILLLGFAALILFQSEAAEPEVCIDGDTREKLRVLMRDGLDAAMRDHTKRAFEVWMKDASDQPQRAVAGMRHGVSAYVGARAALEKWNPPSCKGDRQ